MRAPRCHDGCRSQTGRVNANYCRPCQSANLLGEAVNSLLGSFYAAQADGHIRFSAGGLDAIPGSLVWVLVCPDCNLLSELRQEVGRTIEAWAERHRSTLEAKPA